MKVINISETGGYKFDKEVNKKLGLNASPVEKDDITLKHHTIVIAHKADNNGAKI